MCGPGAQLTAESTRTQSVCLRNERQEALRARVSGKRLRLAPWPTMTAPPSRREITDALIAALDRRHEVLDAIVDADHRAAAVEAVAALLGATRLGAEAVVGMPLYRLTKDSRRQIAAELDDLNSRLTFTLIERPESSGEHLVLRPFSSEADRDLFGARTADIGAAGDGSGEPSRQS